MEFRLLTIISLTRSGGTVAAAAAAAADVHLSMSHNVRRHVHQCTVASRNAENQEKKN
jgi:hypothetical protein